MEDSSRIEELEARIAFQDDAINKLSDALYQQTQLLARLEARFGSLKAQVAQMHEQLADDGPQHQPPPHY